jgi:phosphoribosylformylglycinamidine synthase
VVSGNVSFYNETEGRAIPPTPTIATVGLLDDVSHHLTQWFKEEGDIVVLLGKNREELGGSAYLATLHGQIQGTPPGVDLEMEKHVQKLCLAACREGLLRSAHDISEGGLAVALAEVCLSRPEGAVGAAIELEESMRADALLFGESQSRVIASLPPHFLPRLQALAQAEEVALTVLGEVGGQELVIRGLIRLPVSPLQEMWQTALEQSLSV